MLKKLDRLKKMEGRGRIQKMIEEKVNSHEENNKRYLAKEKTMRQKSVKVWAELELCVHAAMACGLEARGKERALWQ